MKRRCLLLMAILAVALVTAAGCSSQSGDGGTQASTSSSYRSGTASSTSTTVLKVAGLEFDLPSGFEGSAADVETKPSYYYASTDKDGIAMIMTQAAKEPINSRTDITKLGDDFIEGFLAADLAVLDTVVVDLPIEIARFPGRVVSATGSYEGDPTEGLFIVFFNDDLDRVGFIGLIQQPGAVQDHMPEFVAALDPEGSISQLREAALALHGEEIARKSVSDERSAFSIGSQADEESAVGEESAEQQPAEEQPAQPSFSVDEARMAATVALTNSLADDVFADDGNSHDPSRYHSYSDRSGFHLNLDADGVWTSPDASTWHVSRIKFSIPGTSTVVTATLDVRFDGANYIVSNISGMEAIPGRESIGTNLSFIESSQPNGFSALVVPPSMLA